MLKICFKCGQKKDETEFYTHPCMADGRLGKCKECTKKDSNERYAKKRKELDWVLKERERCRLKQDRYRETHPENPVTAAIAKANWSKRNPQKRKVEQITCNALRDGKIKRATYCEKCGATGRLHKHHNDYNQPLAVQWLCSACHRLIHRKTIL